jgi:anti-sigma-K factor RskA
MNCHEFEELSGAYVLGAVTPEERELMEEHIAECPDCAQIVRELQLSVNALPLSVPMIEPSAALKERILASIQPESTAIARPVQSVGRKSPVSRPRSHWQRWSTQLLAAAALILFILLSGMTAWNIALQQQVSSLTMNTSPMNYPLRSTNVNAGVTGSLECFSKQHVCILTMRGLPSLEGTKVYQGWLLQGKQPTSIGLLNVHDGVASVDFQGNLGDYNATAVSVEPGPLASKDAPRGQIIAIGNVKKSVSES